MAIHPDFPHSPYVILRPEVRWFPAEENLRQEDNIGSLLPPLVHELRKQVFAWREKGYEGASLTSKSLLTWWFQTPHPIPKADGNFADFEYYFAQRESVETVIYLHEIINVADKHDLLRFDSRDLLSPQMFYETWRRYVVKMATGTGKTKIMSLILAWSYFHKLYEKDSDLSQNFLLIAPNIIVLDRLRNDFDGLKIFSEDPIIPDNGYEGKNWKSEFQLTLHIQDEVGPINSSGNIFLTNIHRVYDNQNTEPSIDDENTLDYFLGERPTGKTTDSQADLGRIVRDIDSLVVINDEAHHIHDKKLAWFKSIEDIHNRLKQKGGQLSLQIDVTATPKDEKGNIFVQTIADYPLVEAITQNVVKHPVLPDKASREKLKEKESSQYTERYADYINLGVSEWKKTYTEHEKLGKKSILFVMTDDTTNCDAVAEYLETSFPELKDSVLTIHTNKNGEINDKASSKAKKNELELLRKQANEIDNLDSPYKAIVSVLMLKEGWDVKNVTTIVGLRAYSTKSNILPEQTLGRGLRRMYFESDAEEYVSVVGTDAFMNFVESVREDGTVLEEVPMGPDTDPIAPLIIEIDYESDKDLEALDIEIPVLSPKVVRNYGNLEALDVDSLPIDPILLKEFSEEEKRSIVFRDITTDEVSHITELEGGTPDYRSVIGFLSQVILKDLNYKQAYPTLYPKVEEFVQRCLFDQDVDLEDTNIVRNLVEPTAIEKTKNAFKKAINDLTLEEAEVRVSDTIKVTNTRPRIVKDQKNFIASKSPFNRIVGDNDLENRFGMLMENLPDVISFTKNYENIGFKLDYVNAEGRLANYYPDFIIKLDDNSYFIIETKGRVDENDQLKVKRLRTWCEDITANTDKNYDFLFVDQATFDEVSGSIAVFGDLIPKFTRFKD